MAYDPELADRLRELLAQEPGLSEKAMFGGLAFLINGHLAVSASGRGGLLLRVDPEQSDALADLPHASRAVMGGRRMRGWLQVSADGVCDDEALTTWVRRGVTCARGLAPT